MARIVAIIITKDGETMSMPIGKSQTQNRLEKLPTKLELKKDTERWLKVPYSSKTPKYYTKITKEIADIYKC